MKQQGAIMIAMKPKTPRKEQAKPHPQAHAAHLSKTSRGSG
jgi:hypothetical protein